MRPCHLCHAEKLGNITLTVADVNTTLRVTKKSRRLFQVLQPVNTLFFLNRHSRRIDSLLERIAALKPAPGPELHGCQTQGQSIRGHRQTGVHQDAANGVVLRTPSLVLSRERFFENANGPNVFPVIGEFRRVVKDQNNGIAGRESIAR